MAKKATGKQDDQKLGSEMAKSSAALAALAMKGADVWQEIVVYVLYVVSAVAIGLLFVPPYETVKQLFLFGVLVVFAVVVLYLIIPRYRELAHGMQVPSRPVEPLPSAPVLPPAPAIPKDTVISATKQDAIFEVLQDARGIAFKLLHKKNGGLDDKQVRANIFFPKYGADGHYVLRIWPGLHINMLNPEELEIQLEPGQGLTGIAFEEARARVAHKLPEATTGAGWDTKHRITPEIAAIIDPDLKCVVSMPLKGSDGKPIGVMCIDVLSHLFNVDELNECSRAMTKFAFLIAALVLE